MTHEDYKALLAAKALTALDAEDARALDAHLEGCADCRSEMDEWQQTASFLALDAKPIEPPAELRARILGSVRSVASRAEKIASAGDSKVLAFERSQKDVLRRAGSSGPLGAFGTIGSIAAAAALAALIISLVVLWRQNRSSQTELARLSTQMQEINEQLTRQREAIELLTSPGVRMQELVGTNAAPGAHAVVAYDKTGRAMLTAKGLPAAPKGMAYQLWFIVGSKPIPGRVFTTDAAGNGSLKDQIPGAALGSVVFAITLEPEGGMPSPTGAIYLSSAS